MSPSRGSLISGVNIPENRRLHVRADLVLLIFLVIALPFVREDLRADHLCILIHFARKLERQREERHIIREKAHASPLIDSIGPDRSSLLVEQIVWLHCQWHYL